MRKEKSEQQNLTLSQGFILEKELHEMQKCILTVRKRKLPRALVVAAIMSYLMVVGMGAVQKKKVHVWGAGVRIGVCMCNEMCRMRA